MSGINEIISTATGLSLEELQVREDFVQFINQCKSGEVARFALGCVSVTFQFDRLEMRLDNNRPQLEELQRQYATHCQHPSYIAYCFALPDIS